MKQELAFAIAPGQSTNIKSRMLDWFKPFGILFFLDNNEYASTYNRYECLLAAGARQTLQHAEDIEAHPGEWIFGHIAYEYKDQLESKLHSGHPKRIGFKPFSFVCPEIVCYINTAKDTLHIISYTIEPKAIYLQIMGSTLHFNNGLPAIQFIQRIAPEAYLARIKKLQQHIKNGDCYEINFCNEAYAENIAIDPLQVFCKLNEVSPAPFAVYYRNQDTYLMCASPERYLQKSGRKIIAQPIKGTARRLKDAGEDELQKQALKQDIKEQAENVMIVDLMRNDLARFCEVGSIQVDELFGIYTFPQVHQMISTISGTTLSPTQFATILKAGFPMGSMTGAPKIKVMQLIEQYEEARRELFSGSIVYITPEGDFDANVVIRSLFYNASTQYLSYQTGGAITYDSVAEKEWEEMRLKAAAMERIFT